MSSRTVTHDPDVVPEIQNGSNSGAYLASCQARSHLYLHDETWLTVERVSESHCNSGMVEEQNILEGNVTPLVFRHCHLDGHISEWSVLTSFPPPCTSFADTLTVRSLCSGTIAVEDYTRWIWCTFYWYFQLGQPCVPSGMKPGTPQQEWKVEIKGGSGYKPILYQVEGQGLIFNSSSSAQRNEWETFYTFNKTFWQLPPEHFYRAYGKSPAVYSHPLNFIVPTSASRHPLRPKPPAPGVTFYKRYIPSLNSFLTFRTACLQTDVALLHKWMNNPRVNAFWGEAGPNTHQQEYLQKLLEDKHTFPVIGSWKDLLTTGSGIEKEGQQVQAEEQPFGYFEIYWAKEDMLAGYTETTDWDRGVHVLVGEEKFRGSHRVKAWLSSLLHCEHLYKPL